LLAAGIRGSWNIGILGLKSVALNYIMIYEISRSLIYYINFEMERNGI